MDQYTILCSGISVISSDADTVTVPVANSIDKQLIPAAMLLHFSILKIPSIVSQTCPHEFIFVPASTEELSDFIFSNNHLSVNPQNSPESNGNKSFTYSNSINYCKQSSPS